MNYTIFNLKGDEIMNLEIKGLSKLEKRLKQLQKDSDGISGDNEIPLKDLFTPTFMTKYTKHSSINSFFEASPFTLESQEDLETIPEDELDSFVSKNTSFKSWQDMLGEAGAEWTSTQLGF